MWLEEPFRSHVLVEWIGKKPSLPSSFQAVDYVNPTRRSKARLVGVKNQLIKCCEVFSFNSTACHIRLVITTELGYGMARRFLPLVVQEPVGSWEPVKMFLKVSMEKPIRF